MSETLRFALVIMLITIAGPVGNRGTRALAPCWRASRTLDPLNTVNDQP